MYALVKDIYRLAEASAGMKRMDGSSRKGLSPLLAIIIGLVVTIVAGILLAQLYFSYAATISARPAANIEYVDAVEVSDGDDILAINIKNTGNVPIIGITVSSNAISGDCSATGISLEPGETYGLTCTISDDAADPGDTVAGSISVTFNDDSAQSYAFSVRMRSG